MDNCISVSVRPVSLLATPIAPTAVRPCSARFPASVGFGGYSVAFAPALPTPIDPLNSRQHTRQPWLLRPRLSRFVASPSRGYANRPFRATDVRGTSTLFDSQPCRLLPVAVGTPVTRRPRTDPGVRFSRTGLLSHAHAQRTPCAPWIFPPRRLASLIEPDFVPKRLPLTNAHDCHPLPLVIGATVSEHSEVIRLPRGLRLLPPWLGFGSPTWLGRFDGL